MQTEVSRTRIPDEPNSFIVQRVKNEAIETLKETISYGDEIPDPSNDLFSTQTITITRRIGEKIQF